MAKQLNVNLAFTADTSQAAQQVKSLQAQLSGLLNSTNGKSFGNQIVGDINEASKVIAQLKIHLQNATNVNTGTLDFTKLNQSIQQSGTSLSKYGETLRSLGPAGQQAFNTLASSVAQSEIPIRRSNAALTEMWITLKNTARWQISSSILHGFMGAINSAVGYAEDLNKSLNDIRIVTGANVDEMARFAEQANRSAKVLSTSTTEYTKASLIYYQQGLDDQAVKERTDITIKMANASGQSAEIVSDQMTAVWNNFAKGGESLERFADVMVKLGADTASSSDEIATGLEKFAAIGDTIGLSFNNAAAALATVTATTRQSADIVGTAFKTMFARIQGLKLGETLEDGTDLNKYSEALMAVGISIKDQSGQLKDMDNILAEMGNKWTTLSRDQQVALAQTVAGVRQYTQLMALMDEFDFYEENLKRAEEANGSLDKQAEIYAESWQGASDRVKAALQGIYEDLIDDEAFIDVLNIIEKIITYIDNLIDGIGGLGGVLTTVGAILTRVFSQQLSQGITNMSHNLKMMTAYGREQAKKEKTTTIQEVADIAGSMSDGSEEGNIRSQMMKDQLTLQNELIEQAEKMTKEERQTNQLLLDRQRILADNAIEAAKQLDQSKEEKDSAIFEGKVEIAAVAQNMFPTVEEDTKYLKQLNNTYTKLVANLKKKIVAKVDLQQITKLPKQARASTEEIKKIQKAVDGIEDHDIKELSKALDTLEGDVDGVDNVISQLINRLNQLQDESEVDIHVETGVDPNTINNISTALENEANAQLQVDQATEQANQARDKTAESIRNANGAQVIWADGLVNGANAALSFVSAIQMIGGIIDVAMNPDMSGWEKFLSISSSLLMMVGMLVPAITTLTSVENAAAMAAMKEGLATAGAAAKKVILTAVLGSATAAKWAENAAWYASPIVWIIGIIVAAIAVVALLTAGIIALANAQNADAIAAKKAAQTAEELSAAYDECASAYQEMIDTMSEYEEARKSLDQLVEGTDEYKEALREANRAALELIQNNPGKFEAGKDYEWQGDQLVISNDAMKRAKEEGQKQVNTMYAAKQIGQAKADQAQAKADVTDVARSMHGYDGEYDTDGMINSQITKLVEQGVKIYTEDQNLFANQDYMAEKLNIDPDGAYAKALWANRDALIEVGDETKAAADSYSIATETAVRELLQNNDKVEGSENEEEIIEASAQEYQDSYQAELDKLEEEGWGTSGISKASGAGNQRAQDIFAEYVKAAGLEDVELTDVTGTDSARAFKYTDSEGEEKTVTLNAMREVMAAAKANESTNEIATNLAEMVDSFDKWIDDLNMGKTEGKNGMTAGAAEETKNFVLKKDFSQASQQDLQDIRKQIGNNGENTESYLGSLFGGSDKKLDDAEAQKYGYDTAKEFIDAFNKGIEDAEKNWESLKIPEGLNQPTNVGYEAAQNMSNIYSGIVEGDSMNDFESIFGGEDGFISDEEAKALGAESAVALRTGFQEAIANGEESATNFLDNLIGQLPEGQAREKGVALAENLKSGISEGLAQGQQFTENINAILDTVAAEDKIVAYEALANIDWSKWDASKTAIEALGELGVSSEETEVKIKELEGSMRDINDALKDFGKVDKALDSDIDSGEYEQLAKHLRQVAGEVDGLSKDLKYNEKAAKKNAEAILRFDNAIQDVNENYEDWAHTLKSGSLQDQAKLAEKLGDAYADMLDIDVGSLSNDFLMNAENLELMKQAANGSEEAYRQLQQAAGEDILVQCGIDTSQYVADLAAINEMKVNAEGMGLADLEAGASLDDTNFLNSLSEMVNAAGMTAQQATDYLASMGVDAEVETVEAEEPVERTVNNLTPTVTYKDASIPVVAGDGAVENQSVKVPQISYKAEGQTITDTVAGGGVALKVTSATKSSGGNFKFKNSSHGGGVNGPSGPKNSGGGGGGGGGGSNKKKPPKKEKIESTELKDRKDEIERYHEITAALEDYNRALDRVSKKKDAAWGKNRIKYIQEEIDKTKEIVALNKQYLKEIEDNLGKDKAKIESLGASIDPNTGRINNYDELMNSWLDQHDASMRTYDAEADRIAELQYQLDLMNETEGNEEAKWKLEEDIEDAKEANDSFKESADKAYDERIKALELYEETDQLYKDTIVENEELIRKIAELRLEEINTKVEIQVEFNEQQLEVIDYYVEKVAESFYGIEKYLDQLQKKLPILKDNVVLAYQPFNDILYDFNNNLNNIAFDDVLTAAQEAVPELIDALSELYAYDEEVFSLFSDGIARIGEEFSTTAEKMTYSNQVLEHYKNLMSLNGKYDEYYLSEVLQSQYAVLKQTTEAYKQYYQIATSQKAQVRQDYNNRMAELAAQGQEMSKEEVEKWQQIINETETAFQEAEENYLASLEETSEKAREILLNDLAFTKKALEKSLTGGVSLEQFLEASDRLNQSQEEYLTNTNKMYETNKLINQIKKDISNTDNQAAKQMLNEQVKEIENLQKGERLSNQQLAIQQAKYEVLKAEIALQEAQDAKNQVRLTRDSEGNFGYVYTANQDSISEAEQNLADAQNNLYNIGLDGVKNYTDLSNQLIQEYVDYLYDLEEQVANGELAREEADKRAEAASQYYMDQLKTYEEQYGIAHATMLEYAYNNTNDYSINSIISYDKVKESIGQFQESAKGHFTNYELKVSEAKDLVGDDLDTLKSKTNDIKTANDEVFKELNEKLIPEMQTAWSKITNNTTAWTSQRNELLNHTIPAYENLLNILQKVQQVGIGNYPGGHQGFINDLLNSGYTENDVFIQGVEKEREKILNETDYLQEMIDYVEGGGNIWDGSQDWKIANRIEKMGTGVDMTDYMALMSQVSADSSAYKVYSYLYNKQKATDWTSLMIDYVKNGGGTIGDEWFDNLVKLRDQKVDENSMNYMALMQQVPEDSIEYWIYNWLRNHKQQKLGLDSFDTGGYTGAWGPEGKLAVLHQKELVLDADDTLNFLQGIDTLHSISNIIDQNALMQSLAAANLQALSMVGTNDNVLQQEVTIHAEFPNVQDHNEIELALSDLVNAASQYANREF